MLDLADKMSKTTHGQELAWKMIKSNDYHQIDVSEFKKKIFNELPEKKNSKKLENVFNNLKTRNQTKLVKSSFFDTLS